MMNEVFESIKNLDNVYEEPFMEINDSFVDCLMVLQKMSFRYDSDGDMAMFIGKLVHTASGKHPYEIIAMRG